MSFLIKIKEILSGNRHRFAMNHARKLRGVSNRHIDKAVADLNGFSEKWFLDDDGPLDECIPKED